MAPFESWGTVAYLHFTATVAVSLAVCLNEKIFTDTAGSAMMDTPGKN